MVIKHLRNSIIGFSTFNNWPVATQASALCGLTNFWLNCQELARFGYTIGFSLTEYEQGLSGLVKLGMGIRAPPDVPKV